VTFIPVSFVVKVFFCYCATVCFCKIKYMYVHVFPVRKRAFFIIHSYVMDGDGLLFKFFLLSVYSINRHGPGPCPDG
jgi:hypothetical protein